MRETLRRLEELQELDLQIANILKKKAEGPALLAGLDGEIAAETVKLDERQKQIDDLERSRRQQMGALELNQDRVNRSKAKLDQISSPQEFSALNKEIDSLTKNAGIIQENAKKFETEIAKQKVELDAVSVKISEIQARKEAESAKIQGAAAGLEMDFTRLDKSRAELAKSIDRNFLSTYDRIRNGRGGVAIAMALGGYCKACNMRIPPQVYNELQRGTELHICPSCKRILVHKDQVLKAGDDVA